MSWTIRAATISAITRGFTKMCGSALIAPFHRPTRISFLQTSRIHYDVYVREPRLPENSPEEFLDDAAPIQVARYVRGKWELSPLELNLIIGIARARQAAQIFEIGTFDGRTTLNLHLNAPSATIHTIDLPPGRLDMPDSKVAGSLIHELVRAGSIIQLWGDSTQFDFSPWFGTQDFVFVDAGHGYKNALADSRTALRLVEGRGKIVV